MAAIDDRVATPEEHEVAIDAPRRLPGLTTLRSLWIQSAALLVILLGIMAIVDNGHIAVPDEGVYLAQAENLTNGSWSRERPAADVDPEGYFTAVTDNGVVGDRVVAYYKHPLYPVLLAPAFALGGTAGTLTLSVLGTWGAALTAAFLARRLKPGYGAWALWIVGVGSPLLFDAFITVAHSIAAAFAGLALLGLTRAIDDRRMVHLAYALPSVAVVVALRGEGLILAAAAGGVIGLLAIGWSPLRRVDWRAVGIGTSVLVVTAATYLVDRAAARSIVDQSSGGSPLARLSSDSVGPLDGAWASLARPFNGSWVNAEFYVPLAALGVILAALALRLMPKRTLAPLALLIGAAAASIGMWFSAAGLVTGLFAAFPLLLAGLISLRAAALRNQMVVRLLASSALAAIVTLALNYSIGGATEWGGRFFHLLIPLLVPAVVLGLDEARTHLGLGERRIALACLLCISCSMSGLALRAQAERRTYYASTGTNTVEFAAANGSDLIVLSKLYADGSGRQFWQVDSPDVVTSYDLRNLHIVLRSAKATGHDDVVVLTDINPVLFGTTLSGALDAMGWGVRGSRPAADGSGMLVLVGPDDD